MRQVAFLFPYCCIHQITLLLDSLSEVEILFGIIAGFLALLAGGEILVRGATGLAIAAKVSPVVIGLTVVAFGTSAPELAVSVTSCYQGSTDLAIGNAVGSNITNILLILGLSAAVVPLTVHVRLIRLDVPIMIAAALALWALSANGQLSRVEGIILTISLAWYLIWTIKESRREEREIAAEFPESMSTEKAQGPGSVVVNVVFVIIGLILLVFGSNSLVGACVELAHRWGVSELVIGLTVVAVGTSLPELVTSVLASIRGQRDLAVGNVIGSNIFNVLGVLGPSAIVAPDSIAVDSQSLYFDIPVMVAVSIMCLPVFMAGFQVTRWEGFAMMLYYAIYVAFLVYRADFSLEGPIPWGTTLIFLAPLAGILIVSLIGHLRRPVK